LFIGTISLYLLKIVLIKISKVLQVLDYVLLSWGFGLVPPFLYFLSSLMNKILGG
jgi:hypothetical protein